MRSDIAPMSGISDSQARKLMAARFVVIRNALGLTQGEMAKTIGISITTLSAWENGRTKIDIIHLAKAAKRYGFTTDWIALGNLFGMRKDLADKVWAVTNHTKTSHTF